MTQDMTNQLGTALEHLARASGSTAHLYRTLQIMEQPGQSRMDTQNIAPEFVPIVDVTGSVQRLNVPP